MKLEKVYIYFLYQLSLPILIPAFYLDGPSESHAGISNPPRSPHPTAGVPSVFAVQPVTDCAHFSYLLARAVVRLQLRQDAVSLLQHGADLVPHSRLCLRGLGIWKEETSKERRSTKKKEEEKKRGEGMSAM